MSKKISKRKKIIFGSLLAVVAVGGTYFLANAAEFLDSFTDTSNIADTWNIETDTGNGEVKLATRTCDSNDWFCSASTTCSNTYGDGDYIIVAKTDLGAQYKWKTTNTDCDIPQCGQDGDNDGDNLVADNTVDFGVYPARDACKDAGGRLPTKDELICIYNNKTTFGDNFQAAYYWSATERNTNSAWRVRLSDGDVDGSYKDHDNYVRCVLGW